MRTVHIVFLSIFLCLGASMEAFAGFEEAVIDANPPGTYAIGLIVVDRRDQIFQSGKKSNLLGAQISGLFRSRNDLLTDSDGAMAGEMEAGIINFFNKKNQRAVAAIPVSERSTREAVIQVIKRASIQKTIVVEVRNFWVESASQSATVSYDVTVSVADISGNFVAKTDIDGVQTAGQYSTYGANEVFGTILSQALNTAEITSAINNQ